GERPVRIELLVARCRIGLGRHHRASCTAGSAVGVRWFGFGAAGQRHRRQTRRAREAHLPEKTTAIQNNRFRYLESLRTLAGGLNDDVAHALKMPEIAVEF